MVTLQGIVPMLELKDLILKDQIIEIDTTIVMIEDIMDIVITIKEEMTEDDQRAGLKFFKNKLLRQNKLFFI